MSEAFQRKKSSLPATSDISLLVYHRPYFKFIYNILTSMLKLTKKHHRLLVWLGIIILFGLIFYLYQRFSQSFAFVDEDDHLVFSYFYNRGYQLYRDLNAMHQPLIYLLSAFWQKIMPMDSLYLLVKRHRELTILLGLSFQSYILWRFGFKLLVFTILFEFTKFFLLGNLFLTESFTIYTTVILFLYIWQSLKGCLPSRLDLVVIGLCSFLTSFLTLPLLPFVGLANAFFFLQSPVKYIKYSLFPLAFATLILFTGFIPLTDYWRVTYINNFKYAIPAISPFSGTVEYLHLVFYPYFVLLSPRWTYLLIIQKSIIVICFISLITIVYQRKLLFKHILFLLVLLTTANTRIIQPGQAYYQGFHLLPWYGVVIVLAVVASYYGFVRSTRSKLAWSAIWTIGLIAILFHPTSITRSQIDKLTESYINYSQFITAGKMIKSLAGSGSRLMLFSDETLVFWTSGLPPATSQLIMSDWEDDVPELVAEKHAVMANNPPEFIYYNQWKSSQSKQKPWFDANITEKYLELVKQPQIQRLFISRLQAGKLTVEQKNYIKTSGYRLLVPVL